MLTKFILDRQHSVNLRSGFDRHMCMLYSIAMGLEPKNILEFGCGQSTACLLDATEGTEAILRTNDARSLEENGRLPRSYWDNPRFKFYHMDRLKFHEVIHPGPYDLILHDGTHVAKEVEEDITIAIKELKKDGLLIVHDTGPEFGLHLPVYRALAGYAFEAVTFPYGYGLTVVRMLGNEHLGTVKPRWRK